MSFIGGFSRLAFHLYLLTPEGFYCVISIISASHTARILVLLPDMGTIPRLRQSKGVGDMWSLQVE
ncbi:protein of unknown function [Candidatus Methylomirabilis oxygeniifera]|uniref:Uncharacterized protein n=1 Tax=Methylomirabilis oxygeniifera TaxID=671143 RepID=D5MLN2_METO1|nr:protein of unknown function [Candidatus Methylomirabilis oxyfera]